MFFNYSNKNLKKSRKRQLSLFHRLENRLISALFLLCFVVLLALISSGTALGLGMFRALIDNAPDISKIDVSPKGFSTTVLDKDGREIQTLASPNANRVYATLEEIPLYTRNAFISVEDERFYKHNGIDIQGIARAFVKGVNQRFRFSEGGSSLTQQLLKNNVFIGWVGENNFAEKLKRKVQEQHLAIMLEKRMSKDQILEFYLNTINLGAGSYGVRAASFRYFGKDVSELTISESAVIAGISKNPTSLNPIRFPEKNAERREIILNMMERQGYITGEEKKEALEDNVYDRIQDIGNTTRKSDKIYSYFMDELINQVLKDLQTELSYSEQQAYYTLYSGGLTIESTQDKRLQKICDDILSDEKNYPGVSYRLSYAASFKNSKGKQKNYSTEDLNKYFKSKNPSFKLLFPTKKAAVKKAKEYTKHLKNKLKNQEFLSDKITTTAQPQISLTLMNHKNGKVLAIIGGRGTKEGSLTLNRATATLRQPGSAFKPIGVYGPAIDSANYTLGTAINDAPYQYKNGSKVNNAGRNYRGYMTVRDAITYSQNIPAVKTLTDIGTQLGYSYLKNFGISSLTPEDANHQALALGGIAYGVSNLELNAAYSTIANGGEYIKPRFYTRILDHDSNVLIDHSKPQKSTVIKKSTAYLLTDAMRDVIKRGTSTICKVQGLDVAGKSGSTNSYRDVWFAGFSPYYTCTVWAGYDDDNYILPPGNYRNYHKKIWQKVMTEIHKGKKSKPIMKQPPDITSAVICKKSGKLSIDNLCSADPRGSMAYSELFTIGTVPTAYCDRHISVDICSESDLPKSEFCPPDSIKSGVFMINTDNESYGTADAPYIYKKDSLCTIHKTPTKNEDDTEDNEDFENFE